MSEADKIVYIYQHIPKCGGTSFRTACASYFTEIREIVPGKAEVEAREAFKKSRIDFATAPDNLLISGHFIQDGVRPPDRYGEEIANGQVRLITVLREPLARVISGFYYAAEQGRERPIPIDKRLARAKNTLCKFLGCSDDDDIPTFLDRYVLVGITEYLQATSDMLGRSVGKEPVEVPRVNVTREKKKEVVEPELEAIFKENNARDYELYNLAVDRFRARHLAETGRMLPERAKR